MTSFAAVEAAFAALAEADSTYSAQLAVHVGASPVVDRAVRALQPDSLLPVYSSSKGATATVVALLVERGQLDLDAPVASYWPAAPVARRHGRPGGRARPSRPRGAAGRLISSARPARRAAPRSAAG